MPLRNQPLHLRDQVTKNWLEQVLVFANLENADDILNALGIDTEADSVEPEESSSMDFLCNFIGSFGPGGNGDSQAQLREVLSTLTAHGLTPEVDQLISDTIDTVHTPFAITYKEGYLRSQPATHSLSQDQWWAIGIARLIHAGMGDRVRQCDWEKCSIYFVDWPGRKGQAMKYCCPDHQNAHRQQRHRDAGTIKRMHQKANQSMGY